MTQTTSGASVAPALDIPIGRSLRRACLSYSEVLAQSVSVVAPSTVPAAVLGLIYARAGNATWLSFALGVVGLTLVSLNINQFARRSASAGSLYSYIARGLGGTAGIFGGWALLFGYMLTGMSTLCGFAIMANVLLTQLLGVHVDVIGLFAIGALASFYFAFRDIQLSAKTMLLAEGLSLLFVLVLGGMIWASTSFAIDRAQLTLEGARPGGALAGVVLVIFSFSGFESSTALGDEAKDPLRAIPRSVLQSVVLAGAFFIAMSYVVVLGFQRNGQSLAQSEAPLNALAVSLGRRDLGTVIDVGILLSFFSCTLASINSSARILFAMANDHLIADAIGRSHVQNRTPHVAVAIAALVTFGVPTAVYASGVGAFECQGHFGTLCSFGFIIVYILISVAAPIYLVKLDRLTTKAVASAVGGVAFMLLPVIGIIGIPGSDLFAGGDDAGGALVAVFGAYMAIGLAWVLIRRGRQSNAVARAELATNARPDRAAAERLARISEMNDASPPL
jgi:amino acid transporter